MSTMTQNECVIDVNREADTGVRTDTTPTTTELAKKWVSEVNNELNNKGESCSRKTESWCKQSVYRLPSTLTDLNKSAYKPHTVSIGPYHHGDDHLTPMEEHKHRALLYFLKRSKNPLHCYVDALAPMVQDLKDAYDQLDRKWQEDTKGFLQLMIVDGCFILEILRANCIDFYEDYASSDPIFSKHGKIYVVPYIKRDMLMIENQLPMPVLTTLLSAQNDRLKLGDFSKQGEVTKFILQFFSQSHTNPKIDQLGNCLHILDVYRKSLLWIAPNPNENSRTEEPKSAPTSNQSANVIDEDDIIRSATELTEAGIEIRKSKTRSLKDISFKDGKLELPQIVVDDALESQYLNLMAFERFHIGAGNEVTSYIFFMDNIIDNVKDVSRLHSCRIIQNAIGSDKAVANIFNSLSKDITIDPDSSLNIVHKQVSKYCQKRWHRWRANLIHNYFTNPWASLSVIAAILLFVLTIIQTVFSVLSYNPNS